MNLEATTLVAATETALGNRTRIEENRAPAAIITRTRKAEM